MIVIDANKTGSERYAALYPSLKLPPCTFKNLQEPSSRYPRSRVPCIGGYLTVACLHQESINC